MSLGRRPVIPRECSVFCRQNIFELCESEAANDQRRGTGISAHATHEGPAAQREPAQLTRHCGSQASLNPERAPFPTPPWHHGRVPPPGPASPLAPFLFAKG